MELDDESFTTSNVDSLNRDELLQLQITIASEKDEAEMHLKQARSKVWSTGVYADSRWYNATEERVRRKKRQLQHINLRLAALKRTAPIKERTEAQGFYQAFYMAAVKVLPFETLHEVTVAAQKAFISDKAGT